MKKITFSIIAVSLMFLLGGCGLGKMVKNAELIERNVNPDPLEMHGGKVDANVTVKFPEKYFHKKAYLVVTPMLISDDKSNEYSFPAQTLQGEKIKDNNPAVLYKSGEIKTGSKVRSDTTYTFSMPYDPAYRMSDLELSINAKKGIDGESLSLVSVKIADGIITTPELVEKGLLVDNGEQGNTGTGTARTMETAKTLPSESRERVDLQIFYDLKKTNLRRDQKNKEEVDVFVNAVKNAKEDKDKKFEKFSIASYASPEGEDEMNQDLANGRGKTSLKFMKDELEDAEVEGSQDDDFYTRQTTPAEDWAGFKEKLEESNMEDKELVLRVLSMYSDNDKRDEEIRKMTKIFDELRQTILPELRRSDIYAEFVIPQKSTSELVILGKSNPEDLSQVELFVAAQSAEGADQEAIYKTYIAQYPQDWTAPNNLATYYIKQDKLADAETYLQKAENIDNNQASIYNNYGVLYWAKGDFAKAKEYFQKAQAIEKTPEVGYNLGVLLIRQGVDSEGNKVYDKAVASFAGGDATFNKALAELLNGSTSAAKSTLNAMECEHAYYYYLKAVVAARETNNAEIFENLQKAVKADASLKTYAAQDMEFRNVFDEPEFKSIVQ